MNSSINFSELNRSELTDLAKAANLPIWKADTVEDLIEMLNKEISEIGFELSDFRDVEDLKIVLIENANDDPDEEEEDDEDSF